MLVVCYAYAGCYVLALAITLVEPNTSLATIRHVILSLSAANTEGATPYAGMKAAGDSHGYQRSATPTSQSGCHYDNMKGHTRYWLVWLFWLQSIGHIRSMAHYEPVKTRHQFCRLLLATGWLSENTSLVVVAPLRLGCRYQLHYGHAIAGCRRHATGHMAAAIRSPANMALMKRIATTLVSLAGHE